MPETKEWTLMFYFASDNPLAPGIVSQLKSIKNAGYHPDANVVAQFDPHTVGTPTHIFDVNLIEKLKNPGESNIGFESNDPFVRNLIEDKLWQNQKNRDGKVFIRDLIKENLAKRNGADPYDPPLLKDVATNGNNKEPGPKESLGDFLTFCVNNYKARHYMLFILGHGLVVGNDVFLFDEHAEEQSLSLVGLGEVLNTFKREVDAQGAQFELVSFHSCSVSSLEVAYELQGTANYMLASQSPAFVGSWPYRQILIRIFNDLKNKVKLTPEAVREMVVRIFYYCLHNSADYLLAGYSFDLCPCDLNEVAEIKEPLEELSDTLVFGLSDPLVRYFILLSHWKAQSYWQELYTDLYDFCFCLSKFYEEYKMSGGQVPDILEKVNEACGEVMNHLVKGVEGNDRDKIIVRAEFVGPAYQYSHGLSVWFPWAEPSSDNPILTQYKDYKFEETSWRTFIEKYIGDTQRETHKHLDEQDARMPIPRRTPEEEREQDFLEDMASLVYNEEGRLGRGSTLGPDPVKTDPPDPTGVECGCSSIKNYPRDTRARREKKKQANKNTALISQSLLEDFAKSL